MSYINSFSSQWDNLKADFSVKLNSLPEGQIKSETLNDWYQTRCYRWNSISEAEGMLLEQQENPILKEKLILALEKFRFVEPKYEKPSFSVIPIIIGAVVSIAASIIAKYLLMLSAKYAILIFLLIVAVTLFISLKNLTEKRKIVDAKLRQDYISQLEDYKQSLLEICKKYCK